MTKPNCSFQMGGTLLFLAIPLSVSANWDAWWTYEGISGPNFWGLMNPEWDMCSRQDKHF